MATKTSPKSPSGNARPRANFGVAQRTNGAVPHREAPPPSNLPVAETVVDPEIPWIDQRRFRQVARVDRGQGVSLNTVERTAPIYPFTTGIQLTNDGVGFGEEIIESRVPSGEGKPAIAACKPLRFRRTRSGKVPFKETGASFLGPSGRDDT